MRRDLACSLTLLVIALLYYVLASGLGETALADEIGPAGLPLAYAAVLAILAILLAGTVLLRQWLAPGAAPTARIGSVEPLRLLRRAAGALAIGVGYLLVVPVIGYPFAVALAIAAMAVYQGERPTLRLALVACLGAAALFVLFDVLLGIPMPAPWNG